MSFYLIDRYDYYDIINDDARLSVGGAYPIRGKRGPYKLVSGIMDLNTHEIGIVNSLSEVIPTFLEYYRLNPAPWWQAKTGLCIRSTLFVALEVKQDDQANWSAYRDDYPLLRVRDGTPARFHTCVDAQRAADAHERDLFPNAIVIDDGLSWKPDPEIDWRSVPYLAEQYGGISSKGIYCLSMSAASGKNV
jgi:hypothetical protein